MDNYESREQKKNDKGGDIAWEHYVCDPAGCHL